MRLENIKDITYNYKDKVITFVFNEKDLVDGYLKDRMDRRATFEQWVEHYTRWTQARKKAGI